MLKKYDGYNGNEMIQLTRETNSPASRFEQPNAERETKHGKCKDMKKERKASSGKILIGKKSKATFLFIVECFMNNILLFMNWDFPPGIFFQRVFLNHNFSYFSLFL